MNRGIVFSLDSLIAFSVLVAVFALVLAVFPQAGFEARNSLALRENAMDIPLVLEKGGKLEEAVKTGKVNGLRSYLNRLPEPLCAEIRVFAETDLNNSVMSVLRPGCKKSSADSATINSSFVAKNDEDANFFVARTIVWYRVVQ